MELIIYLDNKTTETYDLSNYTWGYVISSSYVKIVHSVFSGETARDLYDFYSTYIKDKPIDRIDIVDGLNIYSLLGINDIYYGILYKETVEEGIYFKHKEEQE